MIISVSFYLTQATPFDTIYRTSSTDNEVTIRRLYGNLNNAVCRQTLRPDLSHILRDNQLTSRVKFSIVNVIFLMSYVFLTHLICKKKNSGKKIKYRNILRAACFATKLVFQL